MIYSLNQTRRDIVVSLSLQSISSLANKYSLSAQDLAERIASFFLSIGCDKVYDINLARHLALIESYREFKNRKESSSKLPIISSVCPGLVCYTEKTNGDLVIPHLSQVRSPQQIMGSILKKYYQSKLGKSRRDIYHVTLMPCFDKKLEASRRDFKDTTDEIQDVDCVITPIELEEILNDEEVTLLDFKPRKLDVLFETIPEFSQPLTSHIGSESGGYAENLLLAELNEKSISDIPDGQNRKLEYSTLRNSDFIEINIKRDSLDEAVSNETSRYAIVNGFRNIQTIVQRLKRKALKYDYIEVMACPSGCINGGAQCKPSYGHDRNSTVKATKEIYHQVPAVPVAMNESEELIKTISSELKLKNEQEFRDLLYTQFHAVPKMQNLTVSW